MVIVKEAVTDGRTGKIHVKLCFFDSTLGMWEEACGQTEADMKKLRTTATKDFPKLDENKIKYEFAGITTHPAAVGIAFDLEPGSEIPEQYSTVSVFR